MSRVTLHTKAKSFKINQLNFAIPLMAFAGLVTLGVLAVNQDTTDSASAANTAPINTTVSYDDEYITISSSAAINLGTESVTSDASYVYATDNVTVSTNVASGFELYLSSANSDNAALTTSGSYTTIAATSGTGGDSGTPKALDRNSYGYAVPSGLINNTNFDASYASPSASSKFAAVPAGTSDRIRTTSSADTSGITTDVHYGASLTNALAPGTYTGEVIYSAVVTPTSGTYTMSVSPTSGSMGTVLTVISGPTTIATDASLDSSEVQIEFRQSGKAKGSCDVTKVDVSSGHLVTTCSAANLAAGSYDIVVLVPRFGFKDTKANAYTSNYYVNATPLSVPMQDSNIGSVCAGLKETTSTTNIYTYQANDSRTNEPYYIRQFTFGSAKYCMMVENLYLKGGTKLTSDDSDTSSGYTLPTSTTSGYNNTTTPQMYNGGRFRTSGGNVDGSYYSWCAATAGTGGCYNQNTNSSNGVTEAASSICPKGWRLPTYTEQQSIDSRIDTIGINTFFAGNDASPRSPIYVGYYYNSALNGAGSNTYWWSSTQNNASNAYYLNASSGALYTYNSNKYNGYSVRCLVAAS